MLPYNQWFVHMDFHALWTRTVTVHFPTEQTCTQLLPPMSQETTTPQKNTAARFVAGTSMHEGETVWVEAPAPHGTCVWCGEAFEDAGDFRCIAMLTKDEDGDADWRVHSWHVRLRSRRRDR